MTRIVRGLEDEGLAARRRDPDDRRVSRVRATAAGRRVLLAARDRRLDRLEERLVGLSREDLALLGRAADVLRRLP